MVKQLCRACNKMLHKGEFGRKVIIYKKGYTATDGTRNKICNKCIKKMRDEHMSDDLIDYLNRDDEHTYKRCDRCGQSLPLYRFKLITVNNYEHHASTCNSCIKKNKDVKKEEMNMIDKENMKRLLAKLTGFEVEEIPDRKENRIWHLRVEHPYTDSIAGVLDSIHVVMEADGKVIVSKYRSIEYPKGTQLRDIEKELIGEIVEPTKRLKELR